MLCSFVVGEKMHIYICNFSWWIPNLYAYAAHVGFKRK